MKSQQLVTRPGFSCIFFLTFSLLSNAGLPEMNPLLELGNGVEDDFQKMLNEWENHMDSLQVSIILGLHKVNDMLEIIWTYHSH